MAIFEKQMLKQFISTSVTYVNQLISGGKEIVQSVAQYFASVYVKLVTASDIHDPSTIVQF